MSKKYILGLVALCFFVFFYTVFANIPARFVMAHVSQRVPGFYADAVSGTVWQGQASNIVFKVAGATQQLGETRWSLAFLPLLVGDLDLDVTAERERQYLGGNVVLSLPMDIALNQFRLSVPVSLIRDFYPVPFKLDGTLGARVEHLRVEDMALVDVEGSLSWEGAGIDIGTGMAVLGTLVADIKPTGEQKYRADLSDINGMFGLAGGADLDLVAREYDARIRFKPKPEADPALANMIRNLGPVKPDGYIEIGQKGSF